MPEQEQPDAAKMKNNWGYVLYMIVFFVGGLIKSIWDSSHTPDCVKQATEVVRQYQSVNKEMFNEMKDQVMNKDLQIRDQNLEIIRLHSIIDNNNTRVKEEIIPKAKQLGNDK